MIIKVSVLQEMGISTVGNRDLIEIIQFCLKIYDLWAECFCGKEKGLLDIGLTPNTPRPATKCCIITSMNTFICTLQKTKAFLRSTCLEVSGKSLKINVWQLSQSYAILKKIIRVD